MVESSPALGPERHADPQYIPEGGGEAPNHCHETQEEGEEPQQSAWRDVCFLWDAIHVSQPTQERSSLHPDLAEKKNTVSRSKCIRRRLSQCQNPEKFNQRTRLQQAPLILSPLTHLTAQHRQIQARKGLNLINLIPDHTSSHGDCKRLLNKPIRELHDRTSCPIGAQEAVIVRIQVGLKIASQLVQPRSVRPLLTSRWRAGSPAPVRSARTGRPRDSCVLLEEEKEEEEQKLYAEEISACTS
ncbi:hypothetical protein AOLI_G00104840 [Acnodon oligacanthus]